MIVSLMLIPRKCITNEVEGREGHLFILGNVIISKKLVGLKDPTEWVRTVKEWQRNFWLSWVLVGAILTNRRVRPSDHFVWVKGIGELGYVINQPSGRFGLGIQFGV
ncbi:hypothetical protein HanIR_Chr01g0002941 [Helianthus annuus]|nr:hypothetical protein HanIR_Chr01g0002941 [Helianthus annuus]